MKKLGGFVLSAVILLSGCGKNAETAEAPEGAGTVISATTAEPAEPVEQESVPEEPEHAAPEPAGTMTIDPHDFSEFSCDEALNGYGKVRFSFDGKKLEEAIGRDRMLENYVAFLEEHNTEQEIIDEKLDETRNSISLIDYFLRVNFPDTHNPQNGEVLTASFVMKDEEEMDYETFCKLMNIEMPQTFDFTVSGMTETEPADIFLQDVSQYFTISGSDGHGRVDYKFPDTYTNDEQYYMSKYNGDTGKAYNVICNNKSIGKIDMKLYFVNKDGHSYEYTFDNHHSVNAGYDLLVIQDFRVLQPDETSLKDQVYKTVVPVRLGEYLTDFSQLSEEDIRSLAEYEVKRSGSAYEGLDPDDVQVYKATLKPNYTAQHDNPFGICFGFIDSFGTPHCMLAWDLYRAADGTVRPDMYCESIFSLFNETEINAGLIENHSSIGANDNFKYTYERIR